MITLMMELYDGFVDARLSFVMTDKSPAASDFFWIEITTCDILLSYRIKKVPVPRETKVAI